MKWADIIIDLGENISLKAWWFITGFWISLLAAAAPAALLLLPWTYFGFRLAI